MSNFMKIRPLGAELFHADTRTDRREKANSRFPQFCERGQIKLKATGLTKPWYLLSRVASILTISAVQYAAIKMSKMPRT